MAASDHPQARSHAPPPAWCSSAHAAARLSCVPVCVPKAISPSGPQSSSACACCVCFCSPFTNIRLGVSACASCQYFPQVSDTRSHPPQQSRPPVGDSPWVGSLQPTLPYGHRISSSDCVIPEACTPHGPCAGLRAHPGASHRPIAPPLQRNSTCSHARAVTRADAAAAALANPGL